jgi:S-DNA-T family DNA segregation ATPase FtsK/SpoIIIE
MEALERAAEEMERRYALMEKVRMSNITAYNGACLERLRRRVLVIDEYADMMMGSKSREALEYFAQRICQQGRVAGIHLILATRRPDAKVVTGVIKANLQLRVAPQVTSQSNSQIILGEGIEEAQHLLGHGDVLVGGGASPRSACKPPWPHWPFGSGILSPTCVIIVNQCQQLTAVGSFLRKIFAVYIRFSASYFCL